MTDLSITCEKIAPLLGAFHDCELSSEEKLVVEDHLKTCQHCRSILVDIEHVVAKLKALPKIELSKDFAQDVENWLAKPAPKTSETPLQTIHRLRRPALIAATAVLLMIAGEMITHTHTKATPVASKVVKPAEQVRMIKQRTMIATSDRPDQPDQSGLVHKGGGTTRHEGIPDVVAYDVGESNIAEDLDMPTDEDGLYAIKM